MKAWCATRCAASGYRDASGKKHGLCICWCYMPNVNRFVKVNMPWWLWEDNAISFLVRGLPPRRGVVAHIGPRSLDFGVDRDGHAIEVGRFLGAMFSS